MKVSILGTGMVGQALAAGFARIGHDVTIGTRAPAETAAREDFAAWAAAHPAVGLATFADAAEWAELVVNASNGAASVEVIGQAGPERLAGKLLIDAAVPLDFSHGFPPRLSVKDDDSLAEQIQRAAPDARVVKAFSTVNAAVMTIPELLADPDSTLFVAGNDADARTQVAGLLHDFGWTDVIDLGDLSNARGLEMYLALWVRLMGAIGGRVFNIKVVRAGT